MLNYALKRGLILLIADFLTLITIYNHFSSSQIEAIMACMLVRVIDMRMRSSAYIKAPMYLFATKQPV
jgi:hypothetical protein